MEVWIDIPEYEGKYQVSNLGNVKSLNYHNTNKHGLLVGKKDRYVWRYKEGASI